MSSPQQMTRDYLTKRGYLVGTVERRKKFPDRKKSLCKACGRPWMVEISSDLFEIFDLVALCPAPGDQHIVFVQTTSRANHSTRRNKILASMEAKLVLLSGGQILLQSWRKEGNRWQALDEWIDLSQYKQAPNYPDDVAGLMEIKRKSKKDLLPPGSTLPLSVDYDEIPF